MRYAIVSDLHGNRQAWNAVLADIQVQGADEIICLGDLVGYGPAPAEVLEKAYSRVRHFVLGNHDAVLAGLLDPEGFNDHARERLEWTAGQLDDKASDFLKELPLVLEGELFRCAHGTLEEPAAFDYMLDADTAHRSWQMHHDPVSFVGHTHVPALFVTGQSGKVYELDPQDFETEPGKRYIINPGSVGQPRDGDVRAGYCLYDLDSQSVFYRKVVFDAEGYADDLARRNLSRGTSYFLDAAEAKALPPVRELLDFRPRQVDVSPELRNLAAAPIEQAFRTARRWRLATMLVIMLALVGGVFAWHWFRSNSEYTYIEASEPWQEEVADIVGAELLKEPHPVTDDIEENGGLTAWTAALAAPDSQRLAVITEPDQEGHSGPTYIDFESRSFSAFQLLTAPVLAPAGSRFTAKAQFRNLDVARGYIQISVFELLPGGDRKLLMTAEPNRLAERKERWLPTSTTLPTPFSRETRIQYVIQGKLAGRLQIRKCRFFRRE